MRHRLFILVGACFLAVAACGDTATENDAIAQPVAAAGEPTTSMAAAPTAPTVATAAASSAESISATIVAGLPEVAPDSLETETVTDLVYHPTDERFAADSGLVDVIAPSAGGPWPTVVVFHGDPRSASKGWHHRDGTMVAERGRVVFLPAWGHTDRTWSVDAGPAASWDLLVQEVTCAVVFAHAHTAEYGGDPDHLTLYGLSAGGNAVVMAGLAGAAPLDTCTAAGPAVSPQALVPIDADWTLGGGWDQQLSDDPEAFYSFTPWRHLDGPQDVSIHVTTTQDLSPPYVRSVEPDPTTSWLSYRHTDIDLVADLEERGFLTDGSFGLVESAEYAYEVLQEAGYDVTLVVLPGARHVSWGTEGTELVVETVLHAERD